MDYSAGDVDRRLACVFDIGHELKLPISVHDHVDDSLAYRLGDHDETEFDGNVGDCRDVDRFEVWNTIAVNQVVAVLTLVYDDQTSDVVVRGSLEEDGVALCLRQLVDESDAAGGTWPVSRFIASAEIDDIDVIDIADECRTAVALQDEIHTMVEFEDITVQISIRAGEVRERLADVAGCADREFGFLPDDEHRHIELLDSRGDSHR